MFRVGREGLIAGVGVVVVVFGLVPEVELLQFGLDLPSVVLFEMGVELQGQLIYIFCIAGCPRLLAVLL